ncbi:MAG TPA: NAD(P)H-hydrate dehydratase [Candidatus Saccharimonadales bacterium]|nr:NAD(P)H-hydrate dehydratase [Candidatus Saccharimonadales bacterium]
MHTEVFTKLLKRQPDTHKYQYGHVLVAGGSPGMVGAPLLAGSAALRTGAGLVTIASGGEVVDKLEKRVKEIMTLALPEDPAEAAAKIESFVSERKVSVVVIGPGMAVTPETRTLVEKLLDTVRLPIVIDGGALGVLQRHLDRLDSAVSKSLILTPHTGEFQRLTGGELPTGQSALKDLAASFAEDHTVTLVLKGRPTYVAQSDGSVYENNTGNPGLATAGTGDVLAGVIAGMIAQGIEPPQAAEAAAYLHGLAGDIAAADKTEPGMVAGDVVDALPSALKRIKE